MKAFSADEKGKFWRLSSFASGVLGSIILLDFIIY